MQQLELQNENRKLTEQLVILDSCVYVEDKKCYGRILTTLAGKLRKYKLRLVIPRIVLYEVSKVTHTQQQLVIKKILKIFKQFKTLEKTSEIEQESRKLETKYFECHRSDSVILATTKAMDATLVTLDRKLLRTAEIEGVQAYHLKDFIKNWRIEA